VLGRGRRRRAGTGTRLGWILAAAAGRRAAPGGLLSCGAYGARRKGPLLASETRTDCTRNRVSTSCFQHFFPPVCNCFFKYFSLNLLFKYLGAGITSTWKNYRTMTGYLSPLCKSSSHACFSRVFIHAGNTREHVSFFSKLLQENTRTSNRMCACISCQSKPYKKS